ELVFSTEGANVTARVVGLRRDPVVNALQIPLVMAQALDGVGEEVNAVAVKAMEGANLDWLAKELQRRVPNYLWYVKKAGIIQILSDMLSKAFLSTASVMIAFTWLTSLILIFSILGQDINEERMIIAIIKALGFTKRGCVLTILSKLLILGAFATVLCTLFSPVLLTLCTLFLAKTMAFTVPIHFSQQILLNSLIFITATILPSGLILGYFAASIQIPKALRYE
ncbi:MAG: ABC transporter permease, partial [Candidatus Bathyarchaeia archaeon]